MPRRIRLRPIKSPGPDVSESTLFLHTDGSLKIQHPDGTVSPVAGDGTGDSGPHHHDSVYEPAGAVADHAATPHGGDSGPHDHDEYVASDDPRLTDARTPTAHSHDYADPEHTHDTSHAHTAGEVGAAATVHTHDYAAPGHDHDYADPAHTHDTSHSHSAADVGAAEDGHTHDTSHNHDASYAPIHSHPYAGTSHNHDATYSAAGHSHSHNHDGTYAASSHGTHLSLGTTAGTASEGNHSHAGSQAFPVGSVFISVVSTNPSTLLGYGTWSAFATGRTIVGIDAGQTEFDTVKETGGSKTHTLTIGEIPAHGHTRTASNTAATSGSNMTRGSGTQGGSIASANAGGGGAHNNLQPYIVVYMWERTG